MGKFIGGHGKGGAGVYYGRVFDVPKNTRVTIRY